MSERFPAQHKVETPVLDTELEKAQDSLRGRITRKIGNAILGKDYPLQIVSGKEASLSDIKDAGSTESSLDEARSQREKAQNSLRGRLTRRFGRALVGENPSFTITSGKEARLSAIERELEYKHAIEQSREAERARQAQQDKVNSESRLAS